MKHVAYNQRTDKNESQNGFAMLFAVLVSSVLLSVGLSIFNLTVKELILSSSGRESQFSFYAADTGAECALYWDFKGTYIFATSSDSRISVPSNPDCIGQQINITYSGLDSTSATNRFTLNIPSYCSIVTVTKSSPVAGGIITTVIDSRGYNTTCNNRTNPNSVERALKVTY
ncbi:MAG: hypothetical protein AAB484_02285 [Patescibacteria group bacterium]